MHHSFRSAAALLTLIPTVFAAGSAHVVNNCGTDVYFASVAQNIASPMQKLPSGGYSEPFDKVNVGISIKLAASLNGPVTQFEFTWDSPNINYDISNIDGNPFAQQGTSLVPSSVGAAGYPTCIALNCPAGQSRCDAAYNLPDDVRTMVCPEDSDLTFTLCPGGAAAAPPAASSGQSSAAASVPASSPVASQPAFSGTSAPSAIPTSFRTSTTPAASPPAMASSQDQAPVASTIAQSTAAAAPTTPAGNAATTAAPASTKAYTWSRGGGGWNHHHTRRAHVHQFDS